MRSSHFISRQLIGLLIVGSIAGLYVLCIAGPFMAMDTVGETSDCGMSHTTTLCPMTLSGRFGFWQMIIVPASPTVDAMALLVVLAVLVVVWGDSRLLAAIQSRRRHILRAASPPFFYYLHQLFSHGILHPKLY